MCRIDMHRKSIRMKGVGHFKNNATFSPALVHVKIDGVNIAYYNEKHRSANPRRTAHARYISMRGLPLVYSSQRVATVVD